MWFLISIILIKITTQLKNIEHYNSSNIFACARLVLTRHMTKYSPAETGEYLRIFPNFQNCVHSEKDLKNNKHNSLHLGENMLAYLSLDIIRSSKLTVLLELRSRKTVHFSEQILSADKYLSIFPRQMEAIVYLSSIID